MNFRTAIASGSSRMLGSCLARCSKGVEFYEPRILLKKVKSFSYPID